MYLCGNPGTGKTATMNYVLETIKSSEKMHVHFFNAMSYPDLRAFFVDLYGSLCKVGKTTSREERNLNTICASVQDYLRRLNSYKHCPFLMSVASS